MTVAPDAVVLLSGGLDSAVTLAAMRADGYAVHALTIDYGQRHAVEIERAARVAAHYGAEHRVVSIDLRAFGGSALTAGLSVPKDLNPKLPPTLNAIILRCLEKDKAKRYAQVADVLADIDQVKLAA